MNVRRGRKTKGGKTSRSNEVHGKICEHYARLAQYKTIKFLLGLIIKVTTK